MKERAIILILILLLLTLYLYAFKEPFSRNYIEMNIEISADMDVKFKNASIAYSIGYEKNNVYLSSPTGWHIERPNYIHAWLGDKNKNGSAKLLALFVLDPDAQQVEMKIDKRRGDGSIKLEIKDVGSYILDKGEKSKTFKIPPSELIGAQGNPTFIFLALLPLVIIFIIALLFESFRKWF
jgi:hypothetical protein